MSQTILIEKNSKLNQLYALNLQAYTGTNVIERNNFEDLVELLNILPSIDLIITKDEINGSKIAKDIYLYLQNKNLNIPMIVIGEDQELSSEVLQLKTPISWEVLIRNASILLGVDLGDLSEKKQSQYTAIPLQYLYEIKQTPCDLYIRIHKGKDNYQFVKRFGQDSEISRNDIKKYEKQGLKYFYTAQDYTQYFITSLTNELILKLESETSFAEKIKTNSKAMEILRDQIRKMEVGEDIIALTESSINSLLDSVKRNPSLDQLIRFLFNSKLSYAYQRAHLISALGQFILMKQKWYKPVHLEIFVSAAFLSDVYLKSSKQMKISSQEELEVADLSSEEKNQVWQHAKNAAELVKKFSFLRPDVENLIKQHQGAADGIGLPDSPDVEISSFAKIFIVVDHFVKMMMDKNIPKSKREILTILYMQYPDKPIQQIIKFLEHKVQ